MHLVEHVLTRTDFDLKVQPSVHLVKPKLNFKWWIFLRQINSKQLFIKDLNFLLRYKVQISVEPRRLMFQPLLFELNPLSYHVECRHNTSTVNIDGLLGYELFLTQCLLHHFVLDLSHRSQTGLAPKVLTHLS